jgi:polar amino acid transport system permease protein
LIRQFTVSDLVYLLLATRWTVLLSALAFAGGGALGLAVALLRVSPRLALRTAAIVYVRVFQGIPLLIVLFLMLFLPGVFDIQVSALAAAAIGLSVNASAFLGDIWRGCIEAIPQGQWEAAFALGLNRLQCLRLVVGPQAVRISLAPTVGYLVQLIKATSLASVIGFTELTRGGQLLINVTYRPFLIFAIVAAVYFALCWPLSKASRSLERRLANQYGSIA